jgi:hypothetical protein
VRTHVSREEASENLARSRHCESPAGLEVRSSADVLSAHRGNVAFLKEHHVSSTSAVSLPVSTPIVSAQARTVLLLAGTVLAALLVYYFIGVDEGALSVFGKSMVLHEFFHDGRHFLGFPCH